MRPRAWAKKGRRRKRLPINRDFAFGSRQKICAALGILVGEGPLLPMEKFFFEEL